MSKTVNIDFISCVVKTSTGNLTYKEIPVAKPNKKILATIKSMINNPNRTLIDLQKYAARLHYSGEYHHICMPYSYNASYINGPKIPKEVSLSDYQKLCKKKKASLEKQKWFFEKKGKEFDVDAAYKQYLKDLKAEYFNHLQSYINADEYMTALSKVKLKDKNLMFSTENIGWTTFNYPISDDVNFEVKTNFGYGSSAYFYVNLTYRGIQIIPYSDTVRYYYANMVHFGKYTRQYRPRHESWPISLNFVVETANLAHDNPEEFIATWIKNELKEMMVGLRKLKKDPKEVIKSFSDNINPMAENYISVRNIQGSDKRLFKAYPNEMPIAYKADKISGALRFLDNLTQLSEIYDFISESITELKEINISILPEIQETLKGIRESILVLEHQIENLEQKIETVEKRITPYTQTLDGLINKGGEENLISIIDLFKKNNPRYTKLLNKLGSLRSEVQRKRWLIHERRNFEDSLDKSEKLIIETLKVA